MRFRDLFMHIRGKGNHPRACVIVRYDPVQQTEPMPPDMRFKICFVLCSYQDQYIKKLAHTMADGRINSSKHVASINLESIHLKKYSLGYLYHHWVHQNQIDKAYPHCEKLMQKNQVRFEKAFKSFLEDIQGIRHDRKFTMSAKSLMERVKVDPKFAEALLTRHRQ